MPESVRNKLLAVGETMFWQHGFNGTGIQQIVDQAEIPKGSFYNHFASKEAFAVAVIDFHWADEGFQSRLATLREGTQHGERISARKRLESFFLDDADHRRAAAYRSGSLTGNFACEMGDHSEAIRLHVLDVFNAICVVIDQCIAEGQSREEWPSTFAAPVLARFILNAWQGAIIRAKIERSHAAFDEFMILVFSQLLQ